TDEKGLDRIAARENSCLVRIVIPAYRVSTIRKELESCGIDETTIFPDLDGLSRTITERWKDGTAKSPHVGVCTRLRPSKVHKEGVGVFAIRDIDKGAALFPGDSEDMIWIESSRVPSKPAEIHKLYDDFAAIKNRRYGCPPTFNRLTVSWYLNEPRRG